VSGLRRWVSVALTAVVLSLGGSASAQQRVASVQARPATATAANGQGANSASGPSAAQSAEGVVNINTATEDELQRLPLVGPARAAAIVALRSRVQRFRSADDLLRVRGIGRASMRRLRPYVTLNGDTTLASRPGRARAQPTSTAP
jgi:competence protein ComEA